ncbi:MAG: hypothetical protein CME98_15885 [Hyphomonas sp.]|nr:hypothetical protein [Hyphomonas sp.]
MSALEDSLRAVYKLPQRETGAVTNQAEVRNRLERMGETGAVIPDNEMEVMQRFMENPALGDMRRETGAVINEAEFTQEDQETLDRLLQQASARSQAPLGELTNTLQAAGTGEDTILAHLTPGEIILAPQFMDDPEFEAAVERKFVESGLDPEAYVAGSGIANLNPQTGAPEYGFFKKLGKKLKKVVKKVAPIATFIPGVGTALGGVLGGIGSFATKIPGIGGALGSLGSTVAGGIAKLGIPGISPIAGGTAGGFGGIADALTTKSGLLGGGMFGETGSTFMGGPEAGKGLANRLGLGSGTASQVEAFQKAQQAQQVLAGLTPEQMAAMDQQQLQNLRNIAAGGGSTGFTSNISSLFGGGGGGGGMFGGLGNFAKMAGIGALSAGLGKLAYEDAQRQRGVGLTPLVTMSPTGRYNIEAEIARRMGQARPNPVEFGLLPEGTIPELSGGKPIQASLGGAIEELEGGMARGMMRGGGVMAFAQGGAVAMQEGGEMDPSQFPRMDGDINGPGTEQSDDIPAMLSDGEFVMTARAVRGAGSYEMKTEPGGIINLVPSLEEDRERGMDVMYKVMDTFSGQAQPS